MNPTLELICTRAARYGLNLVAAVPVERYDAMVKPGARASAIAPAARSAVVVANGGGSFWAAFKRHAEENPGWSDREHPLDDFTREVVNRDIGGALIGSAMRHTTVYPFMQTGRTLDFMVLGRAAGLCGPSIIGVGLHSVYGPWIAFRAAILLEESIDEPGEAVNFDPCPTCSTRPCVTACPAGAVSFPAGWNVPGCIVHRVEAEPDCAPRCHSRVACVHGPQHRYTDDELAYHQRRALSSMRPYYETRIKLRRTSAG
jgi:epoxyqueuosine reductase